MAVAEEKEFCKVIFEVREYWNDPELEAAGAAYCLKHDENGKVLNKLKWEDPKIAEGTNHNALLSTGIQMVFNTIFALAGSGSFLTMAYGASSTAATSAQTRLIYELVADGTRVSLTNQTATQMTSGTVVSANVFVDTTYTPNISYGSQAVVMATINGTTTLNQNQPVNEVGIASATACPANPTATSGVLLDRYVLGSTSTLVPGVTVQIIVTFRGS